MPSADTGTAPPDHGIHSIVVLIPVFNDWPAVSLLLERLDACLQGCPAAVDVLLVDDASTDAPTPALTGLRLARIGSVNILPLRRNLGHQRAIAVGLAHVEQHLARDAVVVMDGDGEDAPEDVVRLLAVARQTRGDAVVFAERRRRSEGLVFTPLYHAYRLLHRILTGRSVRVGNFSIVPARILHRIVVVSELWNHYAAAVFRSRVPYRLLPTRRGRRLAGQPRMDLVGLVTHGLSAVSVYGDVMGVRLLMATLLALLAAAGGLLAMVVVRLFTDLAVPGWASTIAVLLIVLLSQSAALAVVFVFVTLQSRAAPGFLPVRDYVHYVEPVRRLLPATGEGVPR